MSQKKKKNKKRNASDVGISIAKANIEGNDEARALTGMANHSIISNPLFLIFKTLAVTNLMFFISSASIRSSQQLGERVSISSNPLPTESEISHMSDEKSNNKIDDDEDFKPKFKFCCM